MQETDWTKFFVSKGQRRRRRIREKTGRRMKRETNFELSRACGKHWIAGAAKLLYCSQVDWIGTFYINGLLLLLLQCDEDSLFLFGTVSSFPFFLLKKVDRSDDDVFFFLPFPRSVLRVAFCYADTFLHRDSFRVTNLFSIRLYCTYTKTNQMFPVCQLCFGFLDQ
jgi:hypothetical protein